MTPRSGKGRTARRADFTQAARRMYAPGEVAVRGGDVRFVLDALERQPPAWLPAAALRRIGAVGIGLGAQTVQSLLGEPMARRAGAGHRTTDRRRGAARALRRIRRPAMHQRYGGIVTPLLVGLWPVRKRSLWTRHDLEAAPRDGRGAAQCARHRTAVADIVTGRRAGARCQRGTDGQRSVDAWRHRSDAG